MFRVEVRNTQRLHMTTRYYNLLILRHFFRSDCFNYFALRLRRSRIPKSVQSFGVRLRSSAPYTDL
jgi:hypothetical protein